MLDLLPKLELSINLNKTKQNKMKRKITRVMVLMVFGTVLIACHKEKDVIEFEDKEVTHVECNKSHKSKNTIIVGEVHNRIMADVLNDLQLNSREDDELIVSEAYIIINESLVTYTGVEINSIDRIIDELQIPRTMTESTDFDAYLTNKYNNSLLVLRDELNEELADDLESYYQSVFELDYESFISSSQVLNVKYLDSEFADIVSTVTSVGEFSYHYWLENASKWNQDGDRIADADARAIIAADIKGAIVGGLWGATGGAFFGGLGAIPGGLLGGLVSSSFGSALTGIQKYLGW